MARLLGFNRCLLSVIKFHLAIIFKISWHQMKNSRIYLVLLIYIYFFMFWRKGGGSNWGAVSHCEGRVYQSETYFEALWVYFGTLWRMGNIKWATLVFYQYKYYSMFSILLSWSLWKSVFLMLVSHYRCVCLYSLFHKMFFWY